jgi:TRAP-type C4-dicarboxylate transport system permease small subunit
VELIRILGERLDRLNRVIEKVLIAFVCALVCVITYEVIVRYFFGRPGVNAKVR